jgi:GH15 family glucan-1,4-alpha-glucosidase
VRLIDFMPPRETRPDVVRIVEGIRGRVDVRMELVLRFDYGSIVPWVRRVDGALLGIAGPDAVSLHTPVELEGRDLRTYASFTVAEGERIPFVLTWFPSNEPAPDAIDAEAALVQTTSFWTEWAAHCSYEGEWDEAVRRSLLTLKALTFAPTGGIVAAPTASLPEAIGGVRNWDYRYCWLRDATLTLLAFLRAGYVEEAGAWRDWLLRAIAGSPEDIQIMYGVAGERRLMEVELPWLSGYEGSKPVRIGNAACDQLQVDVYGEVVDALYHGRQRGLDASDDAWALTRKLFEWLESGWREPDEGIWEVRGPRRHFTHSKVMAWVAFDRAVKTVERFGREGPLERWRSVREEIRADVLEHGYDAGLGSFVQFYGSDRLDANLLLIPLVGFLPARDPRVMGTVDAIRRELTRGGFVERYLADAENVEVDGLPPGEGVFLPCSFWLVAVLAQQGRLDEAVELYERLLGLRNDLGLLSEEYDPARGRLVGNFPQAFTHLALVETAFTLSRERRRRSATRPGSP